MMKMVVLLSKPVSKFMLAHSSRQSQFCAKICLAEYVCSPTKNLGNFHFTDVVIPTDCLEMAKLLTRLLLSISGGLARECFATCQCSLVSIKKCIR